MDLKTVKIQSHFYLYCALFYNKNASIDCYDTIEELRINVVNTLGNINFKKLNMPLHSYHYFMGLYNQKGYGDKGKIMKPSQEFLEYIRLLSSVSQLQTLFREQEVALDRRLLAYEEKFSYIKEYFKSHFNFEPTDSRFLITRNWDASGKCIHTKKGTYIFVGWKINGLNSNQLLHEITHSFVNECKLPIPVNITEYMEEMPDYIMESYARPSTFAEESFIRALVVYLDRIEGDAFGFSLSKMDLEMILPAIYLQKLEKDKVTVLTKDYINSFNI